MNAPHTPDDVDLPPSARYIVFVLEDAGGSLPRSQLEEQTELPERTIDKALARLEDVGVIHRDRDGHDLRFVHVEIVETS